MKEFGSWLRAHCFDEFSSLVTTVAEAWWLLGLLQAIGCKVCVCVSALCLLRACLTFISDWLASYWCIDSPHFRPSSRWNRISSSTVPDPQRQGTSTPSSGPRSHRVRTGWSGRWSYEPRRVWLRDWGRWRRRPRDIRGILALRNSSVASLATQQLLDEHKDTVQSTLTRALKRNAFVFFCRLCAVWYCLTTCVWHVHFEDQSKRLYYKFADYA